MYKDLITYQLAEGITEQHLLKVAEQIINDWMRKQPGFIKWEIHKNDGSSYTDIVYWQSQKDANAAEAEMANIPNAADWYSCYAEGTIHGKKLHQVAEFE